MRARFRKSLIPSAFISHLFDFTCERRVQYLTEAQLPNNPHPSLEYRCFWNEHDSNINYYFFLIYKFDYYLTPLFLILG